jgi:hypothetical protein
MQDEKCRQKKNEQNIFIEVSKKSLHHGNYDKE